MIFILSLLSLCPPPSDNFLPLAQKNTISPKLYTLFRSFPKLYIASTEAFTLYSVPLPIGVPLHCKASREHFFSPYP